MRPNIQICLLVILWGIAACSTTNQSEQRILPTETSSSPRKITSVLAKTATLVPTETNTPLPTNTPAPSVTNTPAPNPVHLNDLCLTWEDLDAIKSGMFSPTTSDAFEWGIIWSLTDKGPDIIFPTVLETSKAYIPGTHPLLTISCDLESYEDEKLAEFAIQHTTYWDYLAGEELCLCDQCLLEKMTRTPMRFIEAPPNSLNNSPVIQNYEMVAMLSNTSLMVRNDSVVLRLNINPHEDPFTADETKEILVRLAERIMLRLQNPGGDVLVEPTIIEPPFYSITQQSCNVHRPVPGRLSQVLAIQIRLKQLGYTEVGEIDGLFGPMTEQAVKAFQLKNNLEVDGVVDPITWTELFRANAKSK